EQPKDQQPPNVRCGCNSQVRHGHRNEFTLICNCDQVSRDLRSFASSEAMIFSSPGCSMNEFIERASPCSPFASAIEGFPARISFTTSRGVMGMRVRSHLITR